MGRGVELDQAAVGIEHVGGTLAPGPIPRIPEGSRPGAGGGGEGGVDVVDLEGQLQRAGGLTEVGLGGTDCIWGWQSL